MAELLELAKNLRPLLTPKVGQGYDIHAFEEGERVRLGGVDIPYHRQLKGHSDADVLTHAVMDALLGAAGLPDIGYHFPPGQEEYRNIDSILLLKRVCGLLKEKELEITQVDVMLIAESPKIGPHRESIRGVLAQAMEIEVEQIALKATTNEKLGALGRSEGIACFAVALLLPRLH